MPSRCRSRKLVPVLLWICFLSAGLVCAKNLQNQQPRDGEEPEQTYGVIVDCGSSGTRVNIYEWDTQLGYPELLQDIGPMRDKLTKRPVSKKFHSPLSGLADETREKMHEYIKQVADYIAEKIPEDRHAFSVVYMMATAGMRLLDEETQDKIMHEVRDYVNRNYKFRDVKTSVISGTDEGMYRWISVNAKAKRFLRPDTNGRTKTYAVIEMGGASVQVVYQLRPGVLEIISQSLYPDSVQEVYLDQLVEPQLSRHDHPNNIYRLHSTTFLGFGGDSAHEAYLDLMIRKQYSNDFVMRFVRSSQRMFDKLFESLSCNRKHQNNKCKPVAKSETRLLTIKDPCAPKGFLSEERRKPTRMLRSKDKTIGFIVDEDDEKEPGGTFSIRILGTGNYNKCKKYVEEMLWLAKKERLNCRSDELCTMDLLGKHFVPFNTMDFVGVGDFYHTTNTMLDLAGTYQHEPISLKTKYICNSSFRDLRKLFPEIANADNEKIKERIHTECFRAVWIDTFLMKGLLMPEDYYMFKTINGINGEDPDWPLGAVVDKSLAIEEVTENTQQGAR